MTNIITGQLDIDSVSGIMMAAAEAAGYSIMNPGYPLRDLVKEAMERCSVDDKYQSAVETVAGRFAGFGYMISRHAQSKEWLPPLSKSN